MSLVRNFGAAGDGTTDDTDALQHAVEQGDGLLELSRGTYRLSRPVVIHLDRHGPIGLRGDGGAARLVMTGPGPALHIIGTHQGTAAPKSVKPGVWQKERFPVLSGIEIVGEHEDSEGIRLERTFGCLITGVMVRRCRYGVRLVDRNRNFILSDSYLYENREIGLYFDRVNLHQINIIGNHISYNVQAGIMLQDGEVRNLQITGNDIEYNDDHPERSADVWIETTEGTLREMTIASNTIQGVVAPGGANIRIIGRATAASDQSGLLTIAGNLIGSQTVNLELDSTRGLTISGNSIYSAAELSVHARRCRNLVINGNSIDYNPTVEHKHKDGIRLDECVGVNINGTNLHDCAYGAEGLGGAVTVVNSRDVTISGCQITDPGVRGVHLVGSEAVFVTGNLITDRRSPRKMRCAVEVAEDCRDYLVLHNMVTPGTAGTILPDAADSSNKPIGEVAATAPLGE